MIFDFVSYKRQLNQHLMTDCTSRVSPKVAVLTHWQIPQGSNQMVSPLVSENEQEKLQACCVCKTSWLLDLWRRLWWYLLGPVKVHLTFYWQSLWSTAKNTPPSPESRLKANTTHAGSPTETSICKKKQIILSNTTLESHPNSQFQPIQYSTTQHPQENQKTNTQCLPIIETKNNKVSLSCQPTIQPQPLSHYTAVNFFLATESLSQRVTVVPSGNTRTRVSPSLTLSPKKIHCYTEEKRWFTFYLRTAIIFYSIGILFIQN
jgi:hypothetical protein